MTEKTRATLAKVAALAGVSKMTASRAMRGAKDVSATSIAKVQKAALELGYVGNQMATSLSSQRTDLVGVVVPSLSNIVFSEVLSGIAQGISNSRIQPVFGVTDYNPELELDILRNMLSWRPAGMIVTGLDQDDACLALLANSDVPVVQIMDTDGNAVDACVGISHVDAGRDMANALVQNGRKRFGYVGCSLPRDIRAQKRYSGFLDGLKSHGLELQGAMLSEHASSVVQGRHLTKALLARHPEIDCIYYSNDDVAAGGLFHCIAHDIIVPDRIQLAGFNGLELLHGLPSAVATTCTPRREIGETAARIVLSRLENSDFHEPTQINLSAPISFDLRASLDR